MTTGPTTTPATALQLIGVTRTYPSGKATLTALDNVSFACRRASWTAIMGPSGSGKSTLLNCAAGLDRPDSGQVLLGEQDIAGLSEDTLTQMRRQDIGFVFQQFNLVSALTALQNVELPLRLVGRGDARQVAQEALSALGLGEHLHHKPRELSGGQQQRVAIARALATRPDLLFADEPTGALDSRSAATVLTLMQRLVDEYGQTILMVTHDPQAASYADQVAFLRDGQFVTTLIGATSSDIAAILAGLEAN